MSNTFSPFQMIRSKNISFHSGNQSFIKIIVDKKSQKRLDLEFMKSTLGHLCHLLQKILIKQRILHWRTSL